MFEAVSKADWSSRDYLVKSVTLLIERRQTGPSHRTQTQKIHKTETGLRVRTNLDQPETKTRPVGRQRRVRNTEAVRRGGGHEGEVCARLSLDALGQDGFLHEFLGRFLQQKKGQVMC